jgi:hypothetical protein
MYPGMTVCTALPAPTGRLAMTSTVWPGRTAVRDMLFAAAIVLAAAAVGHAQERMQGWTQDWVPTVLGVPDDAELLRDREIGSSVRMFSFATGQDVDTLMRDWETALQEGGFQIDSSQDELVERAIEFSGTGISNAKIVASVTDENGQTIIEIDATLE